MSMATTEQATTQPIVVWATSKASRSRMAAKTAATRITIDVGVSSERRSARLERLAHVAKVPLRHPPGLPSSARGPGTACRCGAGPHPARLAHRRWVVAVVLAALTLIALISNTTVVLTQIGIGVIVALALDPLADAFQRRWHLPRVLTVAMIVVALLLLAGVLVLVLGPRAVEEAGKFSEQLPRTLDEIENLPLIGGWARDNDFAQRVLEWVGSCPKQFTDDRIADVASSLVSGVSAIAVVSIVTIAALIDGEEFDQPAPAGCSRLPPGRRPIRSAA